MAGKRGEWVYYRETVLLLADHFIVSAKRRRRIGYNREIFSRKKDAGRRK